MVIRSDPAKAKLGSLHDLIARDSRLYAKKLSRDILAKTDIPKFSPACRSDSKDWLEHPGG